MIRAALWTNHLSDLPQGAGAQKSSRPGKFNLLLLLFLCFRSSSSLCSAQSSSGFGLFSYLWYSSAKWKLLFRIPPFFWYIHKYIFFIFFLTLFIFQAPPPLTSSPCAPVGCRAISLVFSPLPPQHRPLSAHAHCGHTSPPVLSLFPSLSLSNTHTPPLALTSVTLLRKGGIKPPAKSCPPQ